MLLSEPIWNSTHVGV